MLQFIKVVLAFFMMVLAQQSFSQNYFFTDKDEKTIVGNDLKRVIIPQKYRTVRIDEPTFLQFIKTVPDFETIKFNRDAAPIISIPMPNGTNAQFRIWVNNTMSPGLQAKFPTIKTFTGQGITDKYAILTMDWTEQGFHAMTLSDVEGSVFIDPYAQGTKSEYISYYKRDFLDNEGGLDESSSEILGTVSALAIANRNNTQCAGSTLYNYRLAVACTGEYAVAVAGFNPTIANVLSAIITSVNRVDGVYEKECSISLNLVDNNSSIVYTNSSTDPYTNNNGGTMLGQNQTTVDNFIGSANYDIGHVFSTGGGGVAGLGVVCVDGQKARGVTGRNNPVGDPFDIDYVAHEIGHQFRGNHTFKANTVSCSGNGSTTTNVEPGSGTTIMAYAGICGAANDLQPNSDPQFHGISQDEIYDFVTIGNGALCAVSTVTANLPPTVTVGSNQVIPINTPFVLTGSATDPNPTDVLTYSWEQMNFGSGFYNWNNSPQVSTQPLFRSFAPTTSPTRFFPRLQDQLNGSTTMGELMPNITRSMRFRLTARDNKAGGGGSCYNEVTVNVRAEGGPFALTSPLGFGTNWTANTSQTVTWDVANTNNSPINTTTVNIALSTDGGNTFGIPIASNVPNSGSAVITVPNVNTFQARVRVMAANSIYYCMSNSDFSISGAVPVNWISFTANKIGTTVVALNWRVSEKNNLKYEIERSIDNKNFAKIGELAALNANSNNESYSFKDERASSGKNFYRIKQIDIDGKASYSNTIVVNFGKLDNTKFEVFPNPAKDRTNIVSFDAAKNLNIQIVDLMGKVVYSQQRTKVEVGEQITLNINNLSNGVYTIKLVGENGSQLSVKKLVKQ